MGSRSPDRPDPQVLGEHDEAEEPSNPAGSGYPSLENMGDKENIFEVLEDRFVTPACKKEVPLTLKRTKKAGGCNLRKSLAWNPAFFTEEGVLDPLELSILNGSLNKSNGRSSFGVDGKMSPVVMLQETGDRPVLHEVVENSYAKLHADSQKKSKNGRQLFSEPVLPVEQQAQGGSGMLISSRSITKNLLLPPVSNSQKRVASTVATNTSKLPKYMKSQGSLPPAPTNSTSATRTFKLNHDKNTANGGQSLGVRNFSSNSKKDSLLGHKSSTRDNRDIVDHGLGIKTIPELSLSTQIHERNSSAVVGKTYSSSAEKGRLCAGPPDPTRKKPSALRKPSPSFGFFAQANVAPPFADHSETKAEESTPSILTSAKPVSLKQRDDIRTTSASAKSQPSPGHPTSKLFGGVLISGCKSASLTTCFPASGKSLYTHVSGSPSSIMESSRPSASPTFQSSNQEQSKLACLLVDNSIMKHPKILQQDATDRKGKPYQNDIKLQVEDEVPGPNGLTQSLAEAISSADENLEFSTAEVPPELCCPEDPSKSKADDSGIAGKSSATNSLEENTRDEASVVSSEGPHLHGTFDSMLESGSLFIAKTGELSCFLQTKSSLALSEEQATDGIITSNVQLENSLDGSVKLENSSAKEMDVQIDAAESASGPLDDIDHTLVENTKFQNFRVQLGTNDLNIFQKEGACNMKANKAVNKSMADAVNQKHKRHTVPFSDEWFAALEFIGEEVLEQKTGPVQHSPPDKTLPEPSPWSPVMRKAQDVGPFDCTKYSRNLSTPETN